MDEMEEVEIWNSLMRRSERIHQQYVETEALNIILGWTASFSLKIKSIDITNVYFHGEKMDRLMLLRLPRRSSRPRNPRRGDALARVPIYGTKDTGRRFWLKLKGTIVNIGMSQNSQCPGVLQFSTAWAPFTVLSQT